MKLRVFSLLATVLLAACATDDTPEAVCRRQADRDPAVHALAVQMLQNPAVAQTYAGELQYMRRQATLRCLQDKGLAVPGGVEPVRPPIP